MCNFMRIYVILKLIHEIVKTIIAINVHADHQRQTDQLTVYKRVGFTCICRSIVQSLHMV